MAIRASRSCWVDTEIFATQLVPRSDQLAARISRHPQQVGATQLRLSQHATESVIGVHTRLRHEGLIGSEIDDFLPHLYSVEGDVHTSSQCVIVACKRFRVKVFGWVDHDSELVDDTQILRGRLETLPEA